jgi:radical S-adenosyl methionine domain-containing protein 2
MKTQTLIPSVNFHLWEPCNFKCKFCFATFQDVKKSILPKGHLPKQKSLEIVRELAKAGFSKITFAGGEPTLCPWLADLIVEAKCNGLTTMIVTNGTGLNEKFLSNTEGFLDWISISIDSITPLFNSASGRSLGNRIIPDADFYLTKSALVKHYGIKLKINTVVHRYNRFEGEFGDFIKILNPERWKIFKVLDVKGQNDEHIKQMAISDEDFMSYLKVNKVSKMPTAIVEDNRAMTGSYIMVDPAGRFFDNTKGYHSYSEPILEVGVQQALNQISYDFNLFMEREGLYEW